MPRQATARKTVPHAVIEDGRLLERGPDGVMISPYGEEGPTPARQQHGDFVVTKVVRDGRVATPKRAVDLLDDLCAREVITPRLRQAGRVFQGDFQAAQLVGVQAVNFEREVSGRTMRLSETVEDARERLREALQAMGNGSLLFDVAWRVIGFGESLNSFSGGSSRARARNVGLVMAALIVLENHYVSEKRMRPAKPA